MSGNLNCLKDKKKYIPTCRMAWNEVSHNHKSCNNKTHNWNTYHVSAYNVTFLSFEFDMVYKFCVGGTFPDVSHVMNFPGIFQLYLISVEKRQIYDCYFLKGIKKRMIRTWIYLYVIMHVLLFMDIFLWT